MSEGDLSGMDREVVEERVVAIDAVVASSNDGGVHGRRSGRPGGARKRDRFFTKKVSGVDEEGKIQNADMFQQTATL